MARRLALCAGPPLAALALLLAAPAAGDDAEQVFKTAKGATAPLVFDANGDGHLDVAVGTPHVVSVLLGNGSGSFAAHIDSAVTAPVHDLASGDFDGDGHADLVALSPKKILVLHGSGDGRFTETAALDDPKFPEASVVADYTGDGKPDLAVGHADARSVSVLPGTGTGGFAAPRATVVRRDLPDAASMATGDFNADGQTDLALPSEVLIGRGDGTFTPAPGPVPDAVWVAGGDVNGDGRTDLVFVRLLGQSLEVALGAVGGGFEPLRASQTLPAPDDVYLGDVDGDGHLDALLEEELSPGASYMRGAGDGTFGPALAHGYSVAATADIDGDGRADLIWSGTADVRAISAKKLAPHALPPRRTPKRKPKVSKLTRVPCNGPHHKAIGDGPKARIFLETRLYEGFGCWRSRRRAFRIDADFADSNFIVHPQFAGAFAAFGVDYAAGEAADNGFQDISVWNMRTATRIYGSLGAVSIPNDEVDPATTKLAALVLNARGSIAWIGEVSGELRQVWRLDTHGIALLDSGGDIGRRSLRLSGSTLTWTKAGVKKSAALR